MANEDRMEEHLKQAGSLQEKADLYFVGLIFTILGLGIQTAKLEGSWLTLWTEVAGWILLAVAGMLAVWRLTAMPQLMRFQVELAQEQHLFAHMKHEKKLREDHRNLHEAVTLAYSWQDLNENIQIAEKKIPKAEAEERSWQRQVVRFAKWSFILFSFGVLLVGFARAEAGFERRKQQGDAVVMRACQPASAPSPVPKTQGLAASATLKAPQKGNQP